MLVPLSWLKDFIDLSSVSSQQIADVLTLAGLEVDKVEPLALGFQKVVVAKVLKTTPHPQAEKLRIATVFDGATEHQVVCGAPNCREGLVTAFAQIGAELTDAQGECFKIKKSKLRGVDSEGMLCSEQELNLSAEGEGIIELGHDLALGSDLSEIFGDTLFEISLTPNLGHCMSIKGIARELSALLNIPLRPQATQLYQTPGLDITDKIKVSIEDPKACPKYTCRYIENVEISPSPKWMQQRLNMCGIHSINNIVDVTNYILLEQGQPLHAFDYDAIEGKELSIGSCEVASTITTLDHIERTLPTHALVISDQEKPLAIAGVIGGLSSSIQETTSSILLESAYFHPSNIRATSKSLNLRTSSSSRFEKTVDPHAVQEALDKAAGLIQQLCPNARISDVLDESLHPFAPLTLAFRLDKANALLGTHLSLNEVENIFHRLKFPCISHLSSNSCNVTIPSYRNDIKEEIDLIEEIARMYGYHHIDLKPAKCNPSTIPHAPAYLIEKKLRQHCLSQGLQEMLTCDLISPKLASIVPDTANALIHVLAPSSIDQSILRPSLMPGLLQAIKHNFDRQRFSIAAFELGLVHYKEDTHFKGTGAIGIIFTGDHSPLFWNHPPRKADFFDLKGILENLFSALNIDAIAYIPSSLQELHPGRQAMVEHPKGCCGFIGEIHPSVLANFDIPEAVYFAQLDMQMLLKLIPPAVQMNPLPIYPGSERDWTMTLKEDASYEIILNALNSISSRLMKKVSLLALYRSDKLGHGKKNITLRFIYRDDHKTLSLEAVEKEHARIMALAETKLAAFLEKN